MDDNNEMAPGEDEQKMPADHQSSTSMVENGKAIVDAEASPVEEEDSKLEATVIDVEQPAFEEQEDATPAPIEVEQEYSNEGEVAPIDVEQEYYDGGEELEMDSKPAAVVYEQEEYANEGRAAVGYGEENPDEGYEQGHVQEDTYSDEMDSKPAAVSDAQVYANNENAPIYVEQEYYDEGEYYEEDSKPAAVNYDQEYAEEGKYYEEDSKPAAVDHDQEYAEEGEYYQEEQVDKGEYFEEVTKSLANDAGFIYVALPDGTRAKVSVDNLVPVQDTSANDYVHQADVYTPEDEMAEESFHDEPAEEDYLLEQQSEEVYTDQSEHRVQGVEQAGDPVYDTPMDTGMMGIIPEDESRAFSVEGSAQPTLKDPPLPPFPDMAEGVEDEEIGQSPVHPPSGNSIEVPMGPKSDSKMSMITKMQNGDGEEQPQKKKREINPDFKDLQSTGKWGTISKTDMIVAGVVGVLIIIGVIVAVAVVLSRDETSEKNVPADTQAPTPVPTPLPADQRFSVLMDALNNSNATMLIADSRYNDNLSIYEGLIEPDGGCLSRPHDCAMSWTLFEDDFPPVNNDRIDRFAMATLFYALGGNEWKNNTNWLSPESYCDWYGIECNRGASFNEGRALIEGLNLDGNNLIGGIPLELGLVDTMITVALKENAITGELPGPVFGGMPELFVLRLQNNQLTGTIPDGLRANNSMGMYKEVCYFCNFIDFSTGLAPFQIIVFADC